MEEKTCVKVVLIGVGGYGKFYLREMEKRTQDPSVILEGVCDVMPDVEKQNPFLLEHGFRFTGRLNSSMKSMMRIWR